MPTAPLTLIFANAAGELFTHPAGYAVLRYRPGTWAVPELAPLIERTAALLLAHGWQRLLADARQMPALSAEAKEWVATHWMGGLLPRPRYMHMAMLQPAEVFARLATSQMQFLAPNGTHYHHFADDAAAHAFLAGLPA